MIYLLLSVFFSSSLFVILKFFNRFDINNFQAIVVNYFVAFFVGFLMLDVEFKVQTIITQKWFIGALVLGLLFITTFNVIALTAQKGGLSVASVAAKMSVIIPVIFGILVYNESLNVFKLIGILLALLAVYLTAYKKGIASLNSTLIILVIVLFFGSGLLDTLLKFIEKTYVSSLELVIYTSTLFLIAGLIGVVVIIYKLIFKQEFLKIKSVIGGIVLGVPNYFSLFYLLKALQQPSMESSTVFTINNVLIVCFTTLIGVLLFKEHLSLRNKIGVIVAVIAILMFYV